MGFHLAIIGILDLSVLELGRGTRQTDRHHPSFIMPLLTELNRSHIIVARYLLVWTNIELGRCLRHSSVIDRKQGRVTQCEHCRAHSEVSGSLTIRLPTQIEDLGTKYDSNDKLYPP